MGSNQLTFLSFKDLHLLKLRSKCQKNGFGQLEKKTEVLTVTVVVIPSINVVAFVVHVPHAPGYFADLFALYGN